MVGGIGIGYLFVARQVLGLTDHRESDYGRGDVSVHGRTVRPNGEYCQPQTVGQAAGCQHLCHQRLLRSGLAARIPFAGMRFSPSLFVLITAAYPDAVAHSTSLSMYRVWGLSCR